MGDRRSAAAAIDGLDGKVIDNRAVKVLFATQKRKRPDQMQTLDPRHRAAARTPSHHRAGRRRPGTTVVVVVIGGRSRSPRRRRPLTAKAGRRRSRDRRRSRAARLTGICLLGEQIAVAGSACPPYRPAPGPRCVFIVDSERQEGLAIIEVNAVADHTQEKPPFFTRSCWFSAVSAAFFFSVISSVFFRAAASCRRVWAGLIRSDPIHPGLNGRGRVEALGLCTMVSFESLASIRCGGAKATAVLAAINRMNVRIAVDHSCALLSSVLWLAMLCTCGVQVCVSSF